MSSLHLERIEGLLRTTCGASSPELKGAMQRLYHELVNRAARSSAGSADIFMGALQVLRRIRGNNNLPLRLLCLHECCSFFVHHGNFVPAYEAASLRYELSQQSGFPEGMRSSLNALGIICSDLGNTTDALMHYSEAFDIERHLGDVEGEGVVLNNLGTALNYAGLYREAIPCLDRVVALARPEWTRPVARRALTNLAQSYYYLGDHDAALDSIRLSISGLAAARSAAEHFAQTIREFTFVQIALELDHDELALEHASQCAVHALASDSVRCRLMADIALARCQVRTGSVSKGLATLERTLTESAGIDSSHRDALVSIARAYDDAGQPGMALRYMNLLLEHIRQRRAEGVRTLFKISSGSDLGVSISGQGADLQAFECLHATMRARAAEGVAEHSRAEMLERLAVTADLKEDASGEHGYRVGRLSALLASKIGWPDEAARSLELAARLHDIGKIGIPDRILGSSQALKDAERRLMEAHAGIGAELLAKSDVPQLRMAEDIARHHHEWWDGTGYPDRLGGNRIPLHARIVALADVFDALTHGRPFSAPWTADEALAEIRARCGTQFDPRLCDRFLELVGQLRAEHADLDSHLAIAGRNSPFRHARQKIRDMLDPAYACGFDVSVATSQTRH